MKPTKSAPRKVSGTSKNTTSKNFQYDLTIGMIVKNDAVRLRTCLETMQPLRDALKCQLIITDTGSTDGTREVAEEFADVLLDFEWCDDFSAARNTGTEIADGRWFVFFDSDHEFDESILEIAKFLQSSNCDKYDYATLTILDYLGKKGSYKIQETKRPLMVNFSQGRRPFCERIHENINVDVDNFKDIETRIKHWGYADGKVDEKIIRNRPLIEKSIESDPTFLKNYVQLAKETSNQTEAREILEKGIAVGEKSDPDSSFLFILNCQLLLTLIRTAKWDEFDSVAEKVKLNYPKTILEQEYYGLLLRKAFESISSKDVINVDKTVDIYRKFKKIYLYLKEKPDITYSIAYNYQCESEHFYYSMEHQVIFMMIQHESYKKEAVELLGKSVGYQHLTVNGFYPFMSGYIKSIIALKDETLLAEYYHFFMKNATDRDKKPMQQTVDAYASTLSGQVRTDFLSRISSEILSPTTALIAVEVAGFDTKKCDNSAKMLLTQQEDLYVNPEYLSLGYGYFLTGNDDFAYIENAPFAQLLSGLTTFFSKKEDFLPLMEKHCTKGTFSSLKEERLTAYLSYRATLFLSEKEELDAPRIEALFQNATKLMGGYIQKIYKPSFLSADGLDIIPPEELFAHFAQIALDLKEKDQVEFVKALKVCLKICPAYQSMIQVLIGNIKQNLEGNDEFTKLAKQIKETIRTLVKSGSKTQANEFLTKYKTINPDDPEMAQLESLCQ